MPVDPIRLKDVFSEALARTGRPERAAYLAAVCAGDSELKARVEELLRASEDPDSMLDAPSPLGSADTTGSFESDDHRQASLVTADFGPDGATGTFEETSRREHSPATTLGTVIAGRYTLVEVIGEGGMGSVYLASQSEPVKRQVALKLIKSGMDSKGVLARFDAERQALALMDHPNIARIYDGGLTPTGQPFFVMELVKGVPLTDYCDAHRLTVDARLQLFVAVCQAVQHAHQKGIIHRDLKPGNVLVTEVDGRPTPKVIDFGVAKATELKLTDMSFADTGAIVGTPAYMSPEQADPSSMDIDTRTDVYALGVILYELLTGAPPIDSKQFKRGAILEMLRMVREVEPPRPSTKLSTAEALPNIAASRSIEPAKLAKLLQGELDWVVMKALEKDRTRRYETANGFAADILRYLADEVVEARPPSAGYRLKKFIRRNKGQVIAASLVLVALLGGIVGTTLGLLEAQRQEKEAKSQEQIARDESAEKEKARADEAERVKERDAALKAESERADELKHRLGTSAMVLANAAYDSRDFRLAAERLDAVPAAQRGWEWRYLKRQLGGGIFTLSGHVSPVRSVAYSPDGTRVITGCGGQGEPFEAKVWDARTGTHLFDLKGLPAANPGEVGSAMWVAFSPDGARIVTAGGDSKARIWDAATGALQRELDEPAGEMMCAAFSPDGTRIATGGAAGLTGLVKVWDARTGEPVRQWRAHRNAVKRLAFSPDGTRILTRGDERAVRVWNSGTGASVLEVKGVSSPDGALAFSPDGKRILAGQVDASARVIDALSGEIVLVLRGRPRPSVAMMSIQRGVLGAAFSPDGTRIVTVGSTTGIASGESIVWDARTGAELLELQGHFGTVLGAAFSPDGQRIITGGSDGTAKLWDVRTGTPRLELAGIHSPVESAAMNADGRWIVTGGGRNDQPGEATIWDARTGLPRFALQGLKGLGPVHSVAITPDGTRVVSGGGSAGRFRGGSGAEGFPGPGGPIPKNPKGPEAHDLGEATVWDAGTGKPLIKLKGLKEAVGSVAISPDGTRVVTAGYGGMAGRGAGAELKVWDAGNGALLFDLTQPVQPMGGVSTERGGSVAFNSDGTRFVTGGVRHINSHGNEVTVRETRTGQALVTFTVDHSVLGVAFIPDGTRIATAHSNNTATIRNATTGTALVELKGHTGSVNSVSFSPDGTRVVTGGNDHRVRVWDVRTGTTLAELKSHSGAVTSVSFSADGSQILTSARSTDGKSGEVIVWDAPTRGSGVELAGHASFVTAAAFNPDGTRVATASQDGTVRLWDARTGNTVHELKGFKKGVNSVAFSADGTRFAAGGYGGPVVKVWDAGTGTELIELKTGMHARVAFAVDGTRIVTVGFDEVMKVWDARTGLELTGEAIPKTVPTERTSADGRFFIRIVQDRVEVVPLQPSPEEAANRTLQSQSSQARYRAGYSAARMAKDEFAAAFYLKLVPPAEHKALLDQAEADGFAALNNLAREHQQTGKLDEAIPVLVEILNIHKAKAGADAPATIQLMDELGLIYHHRGQFEKAIPLLEDVVKARKAKQDPQAPHVMGMLGLAYKGAGRLAEAIAVLEEGAAKDGELKQQLLDVYALAGEHAKIVAMCREQLEILRTAKDEGELPLIKADLLARLGRATLAQRKWADAEPHLRECLTLREKNSPEDWPTFETRSLLGESLLHQKKYAEAEPLLVKGYEGLKEREYFLEPRDEPRIPEALDRLIEFYVATDKPDEMKKWRAERAKYPLPVAPLPREKK